MLEQIIVALIVGFVGAVGGSLVTVAVLRERLSGMVSTFNLQIDGLAGRIAAQEARLERVVYRDVCGACKTGADEMSEAREKLHDARQGEVLRRLSSLEQAFTQCFDDLVKQLKKD